MKKIYKDLLKIVLPVSLQYLMMSLVSASDAFMLGFPLYIAAIYRDGEILPSYVAGRVHGLSVLEKH